MAVTSLWPVHGKVKSVVDYAADPEKTKSSDFTGSENQSFFDVLDYVQNEEKTAEKLYVTGINCTPETATEQMTMTKLRYGKTGGTVAFHGYQSFRYNEASPELAHKIGLELAKRIWGDRFEVVISTHLNTDSIHNHFVINSVSFCDGKRLNDNKALHRKIREVSDDLCREHGLSVIENPSNTKTPRNIWLDEKAGKETRYNLMRRDIDETIKRSFTDREFYEELRRMGYIIRYDNRKYATIQIPGTKHPTRFKTLGEQYTEDAIIDRIMQRWIPDRKPDPPEQELPWYDFDSFKLHGFYVHYVRILNLVRDNHSHPYYSVALRAELRKLDDYTAQTDLLCNNRIETFEQLQEFTEQRTEELDASLKSRNCVYQKIVRCSDESQLPSLISERDQLTEHIKSLRKDIKNADAIKNRSESKIEAVKLMQEREVEEHRIWEDRGWER